MLRDVIWAAATPVTAGQKKVVFAIAALSIVVLLAWAFRRRR